MPFTSRTWTNQVLIYGRSVRTHRLLVVGASLFCLAASADSEVEFRTARIVSESPATLDSDREIDVQAGDLNGDAIDDLVILESNSLFGKAVLFDSTGAVVAHTAIQAGIGLSADQTFQLMDIDRDGDLDLVFGSGSLDVVKYALNNGLGSFGPRLFLPFQLSSCIAAHFAGDEAIDLVGSTGSSIVFYRNDGALTFTPISSISATEHAVAVGRASDDAVIDVLTRSSIFISTAAPGVGTFFPLPAIGLALVDLNGDGRSEIIGTTSTATQNTRPTELLVMSFDGSAVQTRQILTLPVTTPPGIAADDFDQDGDTDLAVTPVSRRVSNLNIPGPLPCEVLMVMNQGDGTLAAAHTLFSGGIGAGGVAVGRFRSNAAPTLCVAHHGYLFITPPTNANVQRGATVALLEDMLDSPAQHLFQSNELAVCSSTLCVDLNQDGASDIVTLAGGQLEARIATSPGIFSDLTVSSTLPNLFRLFMADLNNDGFAEAPVAMNSSGLFRRIGLQSVVQQPAPGYFPGVALRLDAMPSATRLTVPELSALSDLDHDSDLDYVTYRVGSIASNRSFIRVELSDQAGATVSETEFPAASSSC